MKLPNWFIETIEYLWSGWGAIATLFLFLGLWEIGSSFYSELVLPSPVIVIQKFYSLWQENKIQVEVMITARRAGIGFLLSIATGVSLGLLAGRTMTGAIMARPMVSILLGTPPIAWLVLALLWFGSGDGSPIFTVFISSLPVIFLQSMQGTKTLDGRLHDLAIVYNLSMVLRWKDIYLPHILSYVLPAIITAWGISWKVVVMAELLSSDTGIGSLLAVSRSWLDTTQAMAWIFTTVGLLLVSEYGVLEPIKRRMERWRYLETEK
jgi:NitT/TauT family transport system permease protein